MKKLFSLLTLALLSMTVWGKVVTFVPGTVSGGYSSATQADQMVSEGVTISTTKGAFGRTDNYRFAKDSETTFTSTVGNITKVEITCIAAYDAQYGSYGFNGSTGYTCQSGSVVGTWQGAAASFVLTAANGQVRATEIKVTIADPEVTTLENPVFTPGSCEFSQNTLTVTVSCPTTNATMAIYKVVDGEIDWSTYEYAFQSKELYVNETTTYAAQAYYEGEESEWVYATYTKVTPKVATPTFNPASGTEFTDELDVTISCATPGATIMYEYGDVIDEAVAPVTITLTNNATITAIASLEGYEDSETATATYTKKTVVPAGGTYTLVSDVTTLQAGDKIALVGKKDAEAFVMSEKRTSNYGGAMIVLEDDKFTSDQAIVATLEVANDTTWNLKTADGYLYASSGSANQLKAEATVDSNGNANAMITNGENGAASIVFKGTNARNVMQFNYNNSNPTLFACYATASQLPVYIYKLTDGEVIVPAAPTITPESQEFTEPIEVTITNNDENGAVVMYAINDGEYAEYEAPFTVSETTTVKAYAVNNGATSAVVEATYTYVPATVTVANLAEVHALDSAAVFTFTGNIVVTFRNNSNIFVRDNANNSALIYQNGLDTAIDKGTTIAPNWGGTKTIYFNETEIINLQNFTANGTQEVLPFERQSISNADYAAYVVIKNVAIDSVYVWGNRNAYVTSTGVIVRDNWQKGFSPETGKTYDIIGIVSAYQGTTVLNLVEVVGYVPEVNEVSTIAEATELENGEEFTYVSEAVVVYQPAGDLRYTWIKDNSGYSLIYDSKKTVPTMEQGTVLKEGWSAKVDIYNGAKQFVSPQNVEASDDPAVEVNPIEMTTVTTADVHKYIMMKGQTLTSTANKTWANADGLLFYNKFNLADSVLTIEEGKTYDVVGMVTTYTVSGEVVPEIFIISATEAAAQEWALGDVNHDTFVNVADVTALIKYVLTSGDEPEVFYTEQANVDGDAAGIFNVADVTALIQLVLNQ